MIFALATSASIAIPRGASAIVYEGTPDLPLTSSMIAAGGGPEHFSSSRLVGVIAGSKTDAEVRKLSNQFGAHDVLQSLAIFDFAVKDAVKAVTAAHIAVPPPSPSPADGHALGVALYRAGLTPRGTWDVGYMLEHLISHPVHHVVMMDIDHAYGHTENATFHMVLAQLMDDLANANR